MTQWEFYRHMPVYTVQGRRLGRVEEVGHGVDYLHVQQGRVLVRDWYVPRSAIRDVTNNGVYLKVDVSNQWNVPPEEFLTRQGATPGYEYATTSDTPRVAAAADSAPGTGSD